MTRYLTAFLTVFAFVAICSCDNGAPSSGSATSPTLLLTDTVLFEDPASTPIGTLGNLLPLSKGGYLLADPQNSRLLQYDARGKVLRSIGHKGNGPGEFNGLGPIALDGDSVLYILEPLTLHIFDFGTGAFRTKTKLPAPLASSIAVAGQNVYFRTIDTAQVPRVSAWHGNEVINGPALPSLTELEAVKSAGVAANARMINMTHAGAVFTPLDGDTLAVLSQASDNIVLTSLDKRFMQIPVARTQRQGVRPDLIARIAADPAGAQREPQMLYTSSIPIALSRTASGHFITTTADFAFLDKRFSAILFLSVTDPKRSVTCPDIRIPGPDNPWPVVALRGDTAFVLAQEIRGTTAVTMLRKYIVRTSGCKWIRASAA